MFLGCIVYVYTRVRYDIPICIPYSNGRVIDSKIVIRQVNVLA